MPRRPILIALTLLSLCAGAGAEVEPALTPRQAAYLDAQLRKADEAFVKRVAKVTAIPADNVRRAMPPQRRIADPATRVIAVLEFTRKIKFSDEVKADIVAAESERRGAIAAAREAAQRK